MVTAECAQVTRLARPQPMGSRTGLVSHLGFLTSQPVISGCEHTEDSVPPVHLLSPGTLAHHVVTPIAAFLEEPAWTSRPLHNTRCTCAKCDIYTASTRLNRLYHSPGPHETNQQPGAPRRLLSCALPPQQGKAANMLLYSIIPPVSPAL